MMPSIDVEVGGRRYSVSCRAGEEDHLRQLAGVVDARARDAVTALGQLSEARQLIFAALLLADDLQEARGSTAAAGSADGEDDAAMQSLTARLEALAERLENGARNP